MHSYSYSYAFMEFTNTFYAFVFVFVFVCIRGGGPTNANMSIYFESPIDKTNIPPRREVSTCSNKQNCDINTIIDKL